MRVFLPRHAPELVPSPTWFIGLRSDKLRCKGFSMDALEVVHGLEKAGFSRQQAEAITEAVERVTLGPSAQLATKDDIADIRGALGSFRTEVKHEFTAVRVEIGAVRAELKEEIAAMRVELKGEIAAVRAELHKEIGGLAWKAAGLLLAQAAFIIAFIKLIP